MMNLPDILRAQYVKRWHTVHLTHQQSLAEHSFNVAVITRELLSRFGPPISPAIYGQVIEFALFHDIDEVITGDIPTPTKKRLMQCSDNVKEVLEPVDRGAESLRINGVDSWLVDIVKVADAIEAAFHVKQHADGIHARQVSEEVEEKLGQMVAGIENLALRQAAYGVWDSLNNDKRNW